jgi:hypothetical protein
VVLESGHVVRTGRTHEVLSDPTLPDLGVAEPSAVRLRRMASAAGVPAARLMTALADE